MNEEKFTIEYAKEEEVVELVHDMRALADRIERLTKEGRMDKGTLEIVWRGFAEAKSDVDTYFKE